MGEGSQVPGLGRLEQLAKVAVPISLGGINIILLLVIVIIAMIFVAAIAMVWGVLMLIGLILIITACAVMLLNRASGSYIFVIALIIGIVFIFLHYAGVGQMLPNQGIVDFSGIPGLKDVYQLFHA